MGKDTGASRGLLGIYGSEQVLNRGRWQSSDIDQVLGEFSEDSGDEEQDDRGSARLRNPRSVLRERAQKAAQQID